MQKLKWYFVEQSKYLSLSYASNCAIWTYFFLCPEKKLARRYMDKIFLPVNNLTRKPLIFQRFSFNLFYVCFIFYGLICVSFSSFFFLNLFSVMSHITKMIIWILVKRARIIKPKIGQEQCEFIKDSGTKNVIFILGMMPERKIQNNVYLGMVDYEKALNKVRCKEMMESLIYLGSTL